MAKELLRRHKIRPGSADFLSSSSSGKRKVCTVCTVCTQHTTVYTYSRECIAMCSCICVTTFSIPTSSMCVVGLHVGL